MADVIDRARPVEEVDVTRLAAELGLRPDDAVGLEVLKRCWRAGFFFAVEDQKRDGAWKL